jgi:phosphatidate cytidylyltransferase
MLRTRILTALVLLLILVSAALLSPRALVALGAAFLGVALFEWLRLSALPQAVALCVAAAAAAGALALELLGVRLPTQALLAACALGCGAWVAIGALLVKAQAGGGVTLGRGVKIGAALLLGAVAWFALLDLLRVGALWTLSVLALVWVADIAAYFSGRAFGVRKLASHISPGKTWAGAWGALIAVVGLAELARGLWPDAPLWSTRLLRGAPLLGVGVLALLVALSIVGDLFESLVKRQAGAKDSGRILPGHGGVWDRIDASLPVLPLAVLGQWLLSDGGGHG